MIIRFACFVPNGARLWRTGERDSKSVLVGSLFHSTCYNMLFGAVGMVACESFCRLEAML